MQSVYWHTSIFEYIGDYDELTTLRTVCRMFRQLIKPFHVKSMTIHPSSIRSHFHSFTHLHTLTIKDCSLDILSLPIRLHTLVLDTVTLNSTLSLPSSLRHVSILKSAIPHSIAFDHSLTTLTIRRSPMALSSLPNDLKEFTCSHLLINELPSLPPRLTKLSCSILALSRLPELPNTIETLYVTECHLQTLPTLPSSLTYLNCSWNQLRELPSLPNQLETLICYNNRIQEIPPIPNTLRTLLCASNRLTRLPSLSKRTFLNCDNNHPNYPNN